MFKYDIGRFIFYSVFIRFKNDARKNRINVQLGQVSSKFAGVKNGQVSSRFTAVKNRQVSSKFAAAKTVKLAVNLLVSDFSAFYLAVNASENDANTGSRIHLSHP